MTIHHHLTTSQIEVAGEAGEIPAFGLQFIPRFRSTGTHAPGIFPHPVGRGQILIEVKREVPMVGIYLVETLVEERSQQLRLGRSPVRMSDLQGPCLLLSGCQTVAEGRPLRDEPLVG